MKIWCLGPRTNEIAFDFIRQSDRMNPMTHLNGTFPYISQWTTIVKLSFRGQILAPISLDNLNTVRPVSINSAVTRRDNNCWMDCGIHIVFLNAWFLFSLGEVGTFRLSWGNIRLSMHTGSSVKEPAFFIFSSMESGVFSIISASKFMSFIFKLQDCVNIMDLKSKSNYTQHSISMGQRWQCTCMWFWMCVCLSVCVHACLRACVCVCVCVFKHLFECNSFMCWRRAC